MARAQSQHPEHVIVRVSFRRRLRKNRHSEMGDVGVVADALRASQRIHGLLERLQLQEAAGKGAAQGASPFAAAAGHRGRASA